jgi:hypothetical protein
MNTENRNRKNRKNVDAPIPFALTDEPVPYLVNDMPVPYRVRVETPSPGLRDFMVPVLGIKGSLIPPEAQSETRLRIVA